MATFLEKFLERKEKKAQKPGNQPPKTEKDRSQQFPQGQVAQHCADHKTAAAAQPDVCAADAEGQNQPGVKTKAQKDQVGKGGQPWTEGTQKAVYHTKSAT